MKYLPKETCEYLVSLGCVSESGMHHVLQEEGWLIVDQAEIDLMKRWVEAPAFPNVTQMPENYSAFSLEDILRKENAKKVWPDERHGQVGLVPMSGFQIQSIAQIVWSKYDTWPEEVARLIQPNP